VVIAIEPPEKVAGADCGASPTSEWVPCLAGADSHNGHQRRWHRRLATWQSTQINYLAPWVLDIDELYQRMTARGVTMINAIQGPPYRDSPAVLWRQKSFPALAEPRRFRDDDGTVIIHDNYAPYESLCKEASA
jgi:uncharacterized glyoxalase superfamily metalloenzyme YdcJ